MAFKKLKFWFDKDLAVMLSDKLSAVAVDFDKKDFIHRITSQIKTLELKDRVEVFADELYEKLGCDYKNGLASLLKILGPENEQETGMFTEYYWVMPIAKYVEKYGLVHFEESMQAIEEITKRNTGEYTIRPYIENDSKRTMAQILVWAQDKNKHVRRLASEGVRPRLPWASKLDIFIHNPKPIIPILNKLKDDPSKYVQKSVANCINDILKDNPDIAKALIEKWNGPNIGKQRKWIIKHALRNLLKKENLWAHSMVNNWR